MGHQIRALILLGTLKKKEQSNTELLARFLMERMEERGIACELIKLIEYRIPAGTYIDMGGGDEWPKIFEKILDSKILIFATPIWWGHHSSEIQRVIERLDEVHDEILAGKGSRLEGKVGGVVVTGDSDGAQNAIAAVGNFFNFIGVVLPPYATLSVLWEGLAKHSKTTRKEILKKYEEYAPSADTMIDQLLKAISP